MERRACSIHARPPQDAKRAKPEAAVGPGVVAIGGRGWRGGVLGWGVVEGGGGGGGVLEERSGEVGGGLSRWIERVG